MSHISVAEELSRVHCPEEKHVAKNFDQKNDESKEEDQFWDELEEFCLNLDDRPTFLKLEVINQHD